MPTRADAENAIKCSSLPPCTRLLLCIMWTMADSTTGIINHPVSLSELAACTGLARRSIITHLTIAEGGGWLFRVSSADIPLHMRKANGYRLAIGLQGQEMPLQGQQVPLPRAGDAPVQGQEMPLQGQEMHQSGAADAPARAGDALESHGNLPLTEPPDIGYARDFKGVSVKPKDQNQNQRAPARGTPRSPRAGSDDDPDFTEFWRVYPRKVAKGQARAAWHKATVTRKTDPARIIKAAMLFGEKITAEGKETEFIPHPATWLNGERYDDTIPVTRRNARDDDFWD